MFTKSVKMIPWLLLIFFMSAGSCYNDGDKMEGSAGVVREKEVIPERIEGNIEGVVLRKLGECYLKDLGNGKKLLHLEGTPYEMGYAMGYLVPDEVRRITSLEYFMAVIDAMGDQPVSTLFAAWMKNMALEVMAFLTRIQLGYIPAEYIYRNERYRRRG